MRQNADPFASERSGTAGTPPATTTTEGQADFSGEALPLAAELVARLSASRRISANELPGLLDSVIAVVRTILNPASASPAPVPALPPALTAPAAPKKRRGRPRGTTRAEPPKKRGRPRKVADDTEITPPPAAPAAPRLIRRSQAVAPLPSAPASLEARPISLLRGVVRWFDPARKSGGVRLTGLPEDVAVEPDVFAAANITRLFKGQEIEAEVRRSDGRVQVTSLRIPGGSAATSLSGPIAATGGRRPRIVIVEKKLDALKRVAARSEAEHVLGSRNKSKS